MSTLGRNILIVVFLFSIGFLFFSLSGCMTIKGLASDIEEVSGAINRGLEPAQESRRQARLDRAAQMVIEH